MPKSVCEPKISEISESIAELFLLPFCEIGRPPYWNCTSAFDFDLLIVLGMAFWFGLPNVIQIGLSTAELWHHIHLSRWRPAAILDFVWIILDHPRSAVLGPNLVSTFEVNRIHNFGDIAIFRFRRFTFAYSCCYFRRACAASRLNLLSLWKLSTYLDSWVDLPSQHQISNYNKRCLLVKSSILRPFKAFLCRLWLGQMRCR